MGVATALNDGGDESQACAVAAGGAIVGEYIGTKYRTNDEVTQAKQSINDWVQNNDDKIRQWQSKGYSNEVIAGFLRSPSYLGSIYAEIDQLRQQGVNLAKFGAALGALLAGADAAGVNVAAYAGENAAANNALFLLFIPAALTAIDVTLTGIDFYAIHKAYSLGTEEGNKEGDDLLRVFIYGAAIGALIPGDKIAAAIAKNELLQTLVKFAADKGKVISDGVVDYVTHKILRKRNPFDELHQAVNINADAVSAWFDENTEYSLDYVKRKYVNYIDEDFLNVRVDHNELTFVDYGQYKAAFHDANKEKVYLISLNVDNKYHGWNHKVIKEIETYVKDFNKEISLLSKMKEDGFKVVPTEPRLVAISGFEKAEVSIDGKVWAIAQDYIPGQSTQSLDGFVKGVESKFDFSDVTVKTLDDITNVGTNLLKNNKAIPDLQGIIAKSDGGLYLNDPKNYYTPMFNPQQLEHNLNDLSAWHSAVRDHMIKRGDLNVPGPFKR